MKLRASIIGSGIAGLSSAIRLAVMGYEVTVFEKNDYPGGKLSWFRQEGYSFDAGPSLFTQPQHIEDLFLLAGEPIADYFSYQKLDTTCHYFYENGKQFAAKANPAEFAAQMESNFGEPAKNVRAYLQRSKQLYLSTGRFFINHSLHRWQTFLHRDILPALRASRFSYLFKTLHGHNSRHFQQAESIQLFNRFATYNGSNPYQAPGMLSLIPHLEMNEGVFYPRGGMISITQALYRLAVKKGVSFRFELPVTSITRVGGKVTGVIAANIFYPSDLVISNADVYFTYKNLLNDPARATKLLRQERSSSALIFYWGITRNFNQLGLHNILFGSNYQQEFKEIFQLGSVFSDPTVYINITSKMENIHAPGGHENWFVMINVPANTGQDWPAIIQKTRIAVIEKINRVLKTDIASFIATEAILDPVKIESQTASYMGSLYGTSSNSRLAAFFRHPNFSRKIKGLYFVGGSVHPGGGIPLCMQSAKIMSELVASDYPIPS